MTLLITIGALIAAVAGRAALLDPQTIARAVAAKVASKPGTKLGIWRHGLHSSARLAIRRCGEGRGGKVRPRPLSGVALHPIAIEPAAQLIAGLEERHRLLLHRNRLACTRIAADAGVTPLHREGAETTQLDALAASQSGGDVVEYRRHDQLDIRLPQMRLSAASSAMRSDLVNAGSVLAAALHAASAVLTGPRRLGKLRQPASCSMRLPSFGLPSEPAVAGRI